MITPEKLFTQARTVLLLEQPFFGSLALKLTPIVDPSCPTAWTDGVSIGYNPAFFAELTPMQRVGLLAHETLHIALGHPFRRDAREPRKWNESADYAINPLIKEAGMEISEGGLCDPKYGGLSAEAIYSMLPDPPPGGGNGSGQGHGNQQGQDNSNGWGEVRDSPDPSDGDTGEQAWKQATLQAAIQEKMRQGKLPADIQRLVDSIKKPAVHSLLAALQEFVARSAKEDYSWKRPNTRYIAQGLYLPCLHSEALPPIAAVVDTSASINQELLSEFVGALQTVLEEAKPEKLTVIASDARVNKVTEYEAGDLLAGKMSDFPGGGGTDFRPSLKHLDTDEPPICCIYLTDLFGTFPDKDKEPSFPVLWVISDPSCSRPTSPFGECIYLDT